MRPVICALFAVLASACAAFAAGPVTVILQFEAQHSEPSVNEMKRELQNLMRDAGVELNWRTLNEISSSDSFPRIVVVTFHGTCQLSLGPRLCPPTPSRWLTLTSRMVPSSPSPM